jgi:hypothetical protein
MIMTLLKVLTIMMMTVVMSMKMIKRLITMLMMTMTMMTLTITIMDSDDYYNDDDVDIIKTITLLAMKFRITLMVIRISGSTWRE